MILVLIHSDDEGVVSRALRSFPHVELGRGIAVTWEPREVVERALEKAKRELLRQWEAEGSGPAFEYAVLPLSEEQYNALRHMVRRALDEEAAALAKELRRLAAEMRRGGRRAHELKAKFGRLAKSTAQINEAAAKLGLYTSAIADLQEAFKEANAEYLKLK